MSPVAVALTSYRQARAVRTREAYEAACHALAEVVIAAWGGDELGDRPVRPHPPRIVVDNTTGVAA